MATFYLLVVARIQLILMSIDVEFPTLQKVRIFKSELINITNRFQEMGNIIGFFLFSFNGSMTLANTSDTIITGTLRSK